MQFHSLRPTHPGRRARRVGRGGKRGTYSGRGMKGQRARGKNKIRPEIRDFIKHTPKLRGQEFPAVPARTPVAILSFRELQKHFSQGEAITPKTLSEKGLLENPRRSVKLLSAGDPPQKLLVRGVILSKAARKKILAAGGTVES